VLLGVVVTLACVRLTDVTQPSTVTGETTFEAEVRGVVDGDVTKQAGGPAYGVLAVSLPENWELKDVRSRDFPGRMRAAPTSDDVPGNTRAGYRWWVYETPELKDASVYVGRAFQLMIKVRTAPTRGDYLLMYTGGVAATGQGDADARFTYGGTGRGGSVSRHITVE